MSAPQVGVLLPVRLETRYIAPTSDSSATGQTWRLRVRVVPDAVAVTTHDPVPTDVELDAVTAMWRAAGGADLESLAGRRAWRSLAAAVGLERAAWLARTFPPVVGPDGDITVDRPTETRDGVRRSRLLGLPPTIELWLARGGRAPERAAMLTVRADEVELDFADPEGPREAWWSSFEEAKRVGLAAEIDLGVRASDIDVLYAVGIGGGDPGPLLSDHADTGRLGVIAPGSATTSVDGQPATSIGADADEQRSTVVHVRVSQPGARAVTEALAGPRLSLPPVVGGDSDHRPLNQALVQALWPALWGHSLGNVLGYDRRADALGLWAGDNLVPEGPLPVLRVGKQPYGLLPATSLHRWVGASGDPAVETDLVPLVRDLVARWAAVAEQAGGDPGRRQLDTVLRTPTATRYLWRWMVPAEVAHAVAFRYGNAMPGRQVRQWWDRRARSTPSMGGQPAAPSSRLVSVGWGHEVAVPLVDEAGVRSTPSTVAEAIDAPATSLLGELARHSVASSAAAVARTAAGRPRAIVEPLSADAEEPGELDTWALRFRPDDLDTAGGPVADVHRNVLAGLGTLATLPTNDVERGLRAALDTATHRIDPWATAIAWRRLQALAAAPRSLGVYGWVDAPRPRSSSPSPEYLLAPSVDQATVAALLRDRALRDPDADRWQLDVTSDRVRGALRLADEVREGSHPAEALGRLVEAIVQTPALVDALRSEFPLLRSLVLSRLRVRRVCDGTAVVAAATDEPARLTQLGLTAGHLEALTTLAADVDAMADLHVAEAVHGLVRGRPAEVAATTAAAAGVAIPSALDVVRTPRSGRSVTTVALVVLPVPPTPADGGDPRPVELADAAAAAYLDARAGDPGGPDWTWTVLDAAGSPAGTATLADTGLRPSDTIGLGAQNLAQSVLDVLGLAGLAPGPVPGHDRVRSLATALSGVPALPEDVTDSAAADDAATVAELRARMLTLRSAAAGAVTELLAAAAPGGSVEARRTGLLLAARWGITPLATAGSDPVAAAAELGVRVRAAADVLARRLDGTADATAAAELSVTGVAEQIAGLVAPEAACPVLGRVDAASCDGLVPDTQDPRLDPDWLETVSPVRRASGRLEAAQLDERLRADGAPLGAWTNRPGDPWQVQVTSTPDGVPVPSRLVAAFGPGGVLPGVAGSPVAVAVVDRFVETVPDLEHDAGVAFRHDLPNARAPQALLLAVPPSVDEELSGEVLVDIVGETRLLARARMASPALLGAATGVLHLAALSAAGASGVRLEGD